jgi:hypothetical protein
MPLRVRVRLSITIQYSEIMIRVCTRLPSLNFKLNTSTNIRVCCIPDNSGWSPGHGHGLATRSCQWSRSAARPASECQNNHRADLEASAEWMHWQASIRVAALSESRCPCVYACACVPRCECPIRVACWGSVPGPGPGQSNPSQQS